MSIPSPIPGSQKINQTAKIAPILIAGPCSAESEEQVLATALALKDSGISYFRSGVWKPRTNPDTFAGMGAPALPWLQKASAETGLKIAIEVASARHVELALEHGIHLLWIGARTTVNPFLVQEIADALQGTNVPVMIKNPINPDADLWTGAIERVLRAGVKEVMTCHRGFNVYGKSLLRNMPLWDIPIEVKRRFPELAMICDPSHIAGDREFIRELSQKALNLGFEGLMIETHINPGGALSDANQQITPQHYLELIAGLRFRAQTSTDEEFLGHVGFLRNEIDDIDQRLIELLAERIDLAKKIGELKKANDVAFFQHNRWNEVVAHCTRLATHFNLDAEFVLKIFNLIHLEMLDKQGE
jgi:chorismate mutase